MLLAGELINKLVTLCDGILFSSEKELLMHATTWMNVKIIKLS